MVPRLEMQALLTMSHAASLTEFLETVLTRAFRSTGIPWISIVGIVNSKDLEHLNSRELAHELEQVKALQIGKEEWQPDMGRQPANG